MDDVVNRMAKELSDAIAAAVGEDARVEACRERARAAGFEMRVSLEAVIGFVNRTQPGALARAAAVPQQQKALPPQRRSFASQTVSPVRRACHSGCTDRALCMPAPTRFSSQV